MKPQSEWLEERDRLRERIRILVKSHQDDAHTMTTYDSVIKRLKMNVLRLLNQVGVKGRCRGCAKEVWWVEVKSGKNAPYTVEGISHFVDCPVAEKFRKKP